MKILRKKNEYSLFIFHIIPQRISTRVIIEFLYLNVPSKLFTLILEEKKLIYLLLSRLFFFSVKRDAFRDWGGIPLGHSPNSFHSSTERTNERRDGFFFKEKKKNDVNPCNIIF